MHNLLDIEIRPFQPADQEAVKDLVLTGLADHWGQLDLSLNPDLNDIARSYQDAVFLVAHCQSRVIGCGALVRRTQEVGEIVRMSVARHLRGQGIGRLILQNLCAQARSSGLRQLVLETTQTWQEVIEFYKGFGFHITHYQDGDVHFAFDLI